MSRRIIRSDPRTMTISLPAESRKISRMTHRPPITHKVSQRVTHGRRAGWAERLEPIVRRGTGRVGPGLLPHAGLAARGSHLALIDLEGGALEGLVAARGRVGIDEGLLHVSPRVDRAAGRRPPGGELERVDLPHALPRQADG